MTTTADLAVRNGHAQPSAALAIRGNQDMWDDKQRAALVAMGVSEKATNAELAVFFHQCRNTQLDPFLKQIYLIHRKAREGDRWVDKPTTQIGIDGFRVIRDRIADRKGLRVEYEDTTWYDAGGNPCDVWLWDEPATACKVVVLVDGRRFPAVLRFNEYCQRNKDGDRLGRWRDAHAHQIEKCAEADALRKAFPNDMSGLILEDTAPLSDPDAPDRLPQDRRHVTAEDIRQRHTVTAEVVTPPDASPADRTAPAAPRSVPPLQQEAGTAGEAQPRPAALATTGQVQAIRRKMRELGYGDEPDENAARLRATALLAGYSGELATTKALTQPQAAKVRSRIDALPDATALYALLDELKEAAAQDEAAEVPDGA